MAWFQGRNMFADLGVDTGLMVKGVPAPVPPPPKKVTPSLDTPSGEGSGSQNTTPQPISRTHPIAPPTNQYVEIIPPKTVDGFQRTLHLGQYEKVHASFQGPGWPGSNASVLEWLYFGVVWTGGYTVFTYTDFVNEWRDYDGSILGLFEPHRLLRTFITVAVTIGMTYVLPTIEVLVRLTERFYYFVRNVFHWSGDAIERVKLAWAQWLNVVSRLRNRWN